MKRFLNSSTLVVIVSLLCVGCAKQAAKQPQNALAAPHVVTIPMFATASVNAIGGAKAWSNTEVIKGECTAKFYKPDGMFYLTRQRHAVYPWSDSIRIYAAEPEGTFVWQLSENDFVLLEGSPQQAANLPMTLCDPSIARVIWSMMASPASIATNTDPNTAALGQAVRVEGLWHHPLKLAGGQTWYQNIDSGIFDIYRLKTLPKNAYLMARSYDYRQIDVQAWGSEGKSENGGQKQVDYVVYRPKGQIFVPTKIEIFTTDSPTSELRRIIELDYHSLESVGF